MDMVMFHVVALLLILAAKVNGYEYGWYGYDYENQRTASLPTYPVHTVHKVTPQHHILVEPMDEDTGYNFTLSSQDLNNLVSSVNVGNAPDSYNAVANCQVIYSDGTIKYMNLAEVKTWKKSLYVKDKSGNGDFEIYVTGGAAPPEKKSFLGRLSGRGSKSNKSSSTSGV